MVDALSFCLVRPRARVTAALSAALLVGTTALWLSGGLRAADTPESVRPGREVDQHLFRTTLTGAHVANVTKFGQTTRLLVINAWVTNPTRQTLGTTGLGNDVFSHGMFLYWKTANGPRPKLVDAQAIAGSTLYRSLQPRMPTYVAVQYQITATTRVPDHVTVALASYEHTQAGILDPRGYWDWEARRYETAHETNPLTHKSGRVTHIIPVLLANVSLPVKQ